MMGSENTNCYSSWCKLHNTILNVLNILYFHATDITTNAHTFYECNLRTDIRDLKTWIVFFSISFRESVPITVIWINTAVRERNKFIDVATHTRSLVLYCRHRKSSLVWYCNYNITFNVVRHTYYNYEKAYNNINNEEKVYNSRTFRTNRRSVF